MIEREPRLRTIVQINLRFIAAAAALAYGWMCWQWTSAQWWGLGLTAILMFIGGGGMFVAAIVKIVALVVRDRELNAFARQGGPARADRMAGERDLRKRGMIR